MMTNWRNAFKSDFMAAWDIDTSVVLTISRVEQKEVQLQKKELKNIAYFSEATFPNGERVKPMILNATNCKRLNTFTGTKDISSWVNLQIEIGTAENKGRIGEATGLAILRVISGGFNILEEIHRIYPGLRNGLTEEEAAGIDRVLNNNEFNSYQKVYNFLKSKM